jgi:hypothetical protein
VAKQSNRERERERERLLLPAVAVATGIALAALALAATIAAQDPVVGAFLGSREGTGWGDIESVCVVLSQYWLLIDMTCKKFS